ncbi:hypothetical protein L1049_009178 [Liquidambar formosana]|uniref:PHD-type domain-containing protein n=1 Tax=Liquidambar formosana TaxID=63359 RepID=A0AAP0X9T6_LIQFO
MKRELAFVLEVQSQLCGSLGRTRSNKVQSPLSTPRNGGSEDTSKRRLNDFSESGGSADQSQQRGLGSNACNGVSENAENKRFKSSSMEENAMDDENPMVDEVPNNDAVEALIGEEPECNLAQRMCEDGLSSELAQSVVKEESKDGILKSLTDNGGTLGNPVVNDDDGKKVQSVVLEKPLRRFTRSALKPKVEPVESWVSGTCSPGLSDGPKDKALPKVEGEENTAVSTSGTPKKVELKMSKKIALNKVPSTVKELLETGLLEGIQVIYNYGKKSSRIQGTIKDVGILCYCWLCKGRKVVTPSKFERHACNSYRRMAKYIHLSNGKSFQEVLKACKDASLETLEATIRNAIGSLPVKKSCICKKCKRSFPPSNAEKVGPLCNSCSRSKKSQASLTHKTGRRARSSKPILVSKSFKGASRGISSTKKIQWKITKKDQRLHKLVFEEGGLPDGTELGYYIRGQKLLEGYKQGLGIFCRCCNKEVSPSQFEAHAGCGSRRKPYSYIYTSNGVSLHELSISLSKGRKYSAKDNDDLCIICADGGNLVLCDGCPRAFHKECASLLSTPRGKWYCKYCQNMFQRERFVEHNANALAAGRVSGVDPIEQITKRCIRIVKNPEAEVSACVLCRGYDFSKSGFHRRTIILCDQCEKEFHVGCLKDHKMADLKELPEGKWFCCVDCSRIHSTLQKLLVGGAEKLPDSLLTVMKKKHEEKGSDTNTDLDVRWRLLSGKIASSETRSLLSQAVAIFHECFDPINDSTTGRDLIPSMVYGRNIGGQEFGGMYCAVLMVNSSVVSAGVLRVYGREVAELPLVATSNDNQGKGYFQILFSCIEKLLAFLNVRSIVLPAADEAESIWTDKFGFKKIAPDKISNLRKNCYQMMTFKGTSMLQKMVPECRIIRRDIE